MGLGKREFGHIKSLVHFDYPYFGEPGDGLRDEVGNVSWENTNSAVLAGTEAPVAATFAPKFGYRCLYGTTAATYITGTAVEGYFDITLKTRREFEFFMKPSSSAITAGDVMKVTNEAGDASYLFTNASGFAVKVGSKSISLASGSITTDWNHVKICFDKGTCTVFVNGAKKASGAYTDEITGTSIITLGQLAGGIDEFVMRDTCTSESSDSTCKVPDNPYNGSISIIGIGGNGKHGDLALTSGTTNINTVAAITAIQSTSQFTIDYTTDTKTKGLHGEFTTGDELFIIANEFNSVDSAESPSTLTGQYAIRTITNISGSTITINAPITEFEFTNTIAAAGDYTYTAHLIPNYKSVNIGASATVSPRKTDNNDFNGGLVIFRSKGDVIINGKIYTATDRFGRQRRDYAQMTHNDLPERFITGNSGGVIILSEGTVSVATAARIGGSWSGAGKGGAKVSSTSAKIHGNYGGAGYGGSGGADYNGGTKSSSSAGGVGGGGGPGIADYIGSTCKTFNGGVVGGKGRTGGYSTRTASMKGGAQGVTHGAQGEEAGGGAGGAAYTKSGAGANVMIICKKLSAAKEAISTGGRRGIYHEATANGGGGTGFCYLAYGEAE